MNDMVFSWAEDATGKMVHVDSVKQGLDCCCVCPNCRERLIARHGTVRTHGFAHHSDERGANLKICYMVTMYKLAEQIIMQEKRIFTPYYYGIFKGGTIEFSEVSIDNRFDRDDKQPDVIAKTSDGTQYLIEFTFASKVSHKERIDYANLNCIEVDLSNQTLETLWEFLLNSNENKKWLNNQGFFDKIESIYLESGRYVKIKEESDCKCCGLNNHLCCGIKLKDSHRLIIIENNGKQYRICKTEEFNSSKRQLHENGVNSEGRQRLNNQGCVDQFDEELYSMDIEQFYFGSDEKKSVEMSNQEKNHKNSISIENRTCFICKRNLAWLCRDGYACCGMGRPHKEKPETAKECDYFDVKES